MKPQRAMHGFHAVLARVRADPTTVTEILLDETRADARARDLISAAEVAGVRVMKVPVQRLDGFCGGARHQGVVALVEERSKQDSLDELLDGLSTPPFLLALDGITDPHNLGACLRVADGAGVHAVIAPRDRAVGINATVTRVASGAAESVPYFSVTNLARTLAELKERGIWVVGTDDESPLDLYSADLPGPLAWVLGAEGQGMRRLTRECCDLLVRIPMQGAVRSLNVSVACGVCLYETLRRRRETRA